MSRYKHNCDGCIFMGEHKELDVYLCENNHKSRTILMRHGNEPSEYYSGTLFECAELTSMDIFCLMNGLELTEKEEKKLLKTLCSMFKGKLTQKDYNKHGSSLVLGKGNVMFSDIF